MLFSDLPTYFWLICLGVFFASFVQSSVGVGFGLVATPILLLVMNDKSAVQISILTAGILMLCLLPSVWRSINFKAAKNLLIPATFALPVGLLIFAYLPNWLLKIAAAVVVVLVLLDLIRSTLAPANESHQKTGISLRVHAWLMGSLSGFLEVICAIPGPAIIAHLVKVETRKQNIRATVIFVMAVYSVCVMFVSLIYPGVSYETLRLSFLTLPVIAVGGVLGAYTVQFISEWLFRWLVIALVAAMACVLIASTI